MHAALVIWCGTIEVIQQLDGQDANRGGAWRAVGPREEMTEKSREGYGPKARRREERAEEEGEKSEYRAVARGVVKFGFVSFEPINNPARRRYRVPPMRHTPRDRARPRIWASNSRIPYTIDLARLLWRFRR